MDSLPSVETLTDSEPDEPASLRPVIELSDSDKDCDAPDLSPEKWRRKRTAKAREESAKSFKQRLSGQTFVRAALGKKCVRCRHHCMDKFSSVERFAKLVAFRKEWTDLRKLDQGRIVTAQRFIQEFSCSPYVPIWVFHGCLKNLRPCQRPTLITQFEPSRGICTGEGYPDSSAN